MRLFSENSSVLLSMGQFNRVKIEVLGKISRTCRVRSTHYLVKELVDKNTDLQQIQHDGMETNVFTGLGKVSGIDVGIYGHIYNKTAGSMSIMGAEKLEKVF